MTPKEMQSVGKHENGARSERISVGNLLNECYGDLTSIEGRHRVWIEGYNASDVAEIPCPEPNAGFRGVRRVCSRHWCCNWDRVDSGRWYAHVPLSCALS